jgi:hypothetical protein
MYTPIIAGRVRSASTEFSQHKILKISHLVFFFALAITAMHAHSQESQGAAEARYQTDRRNCLNGHTDEDQKTCLKEAGAALEASRRGQLNDSNAQYNKDATLRCQALSADDRDACMRRMQGEGSVSGSAASGGIYRELVTPIPAPRDIPSSSDADKKVDSRILTPEDVSK